MTPQVVLELASLGHRCWCERMLAAGWKAGSSFDAASRTHDALVPFGQLNDHDRRIACYAIEAAGLPELLERTIEYDRGPDREFSAEEMRVGRRVGLADAPAQPEGAPEVGTIISWEIDPVTQQPALIRVRWSSGEVSEHYPSERELRRLEEPELAG